MKEEELIDLKYRQLQKLAKEHGIKANLPKAALIEALLEKNSSNDHEQSTKEETSEEPEIQSESPKEENKIDIPIETLCEKDENLPPSSVDSNSEVEPAPTSRRNSRKKSSDQSNAKREMSTGKKSFDKNAFDKELAQVEQLTNEIINSMPGKRSTRNSSSVEAAASQVDGTKTPIEDGGKNLSNDKSLLNVSRPNSRISRLFDKEAFEVEAAKVSRYAQQIVNSPRKRSSILNLTPVMKGQTSSAVNSPLVSKNVKTPAVNSPLVGKNPKTPLHKRPSMTAKLTDVKKKKSVTMKPNPGSVTKAKERTTGIPRPKGVGVKKVPDFAKLHAKQFGKMDNLDQYLGKKKERMAGLTPGPKSQVKSSATTARKNLVTEVPKANFNFGGKTETAANKKPFVFKANTKTARPNTTPKTNKILSNITNNKQPGNEEKQSETDKGYKPYTGRVKPWNAKDSLKNRQQMASKTGNGNKSVKEKQMSHIKGVRMNKRMELMLQKRNAKN